MQKGNRIKKDIRFVLNYLFQTKFELHYRYPYPGAMYKELIVKHNPNYLHYRTLPDKEHINLVEYYTSIGFMLTKRR